MLPNIANNEIEERRCSQDLNLDLFPIPNFFQLVDFLAEKEDN